MSRAADRVVADEPVDDPDGWARARYRLRDLRGADPGLAFGLLVVLLVPFAVSLVRAFHAGWVPDGDVANIATRSLDVFSRHPPLTGLPSTSSLYGTKIPTNHPGPIEFYLLAIPVRAFGMTAGPLFTAAAINASFVLIAAYAFFRRLGSTAMLWAGVLLAAVMLTGGTVVLTDPLSSSMTMYSLVATSVLAWAVIDGDLPLLPLTAFVASYAAQQHLAAGLIVLLVAAFVFAAVAFRTVRRVRAGDTGAKRAAIGWTAAAVAVAGVCWTPVIVDEVTGHPGNLTAIVRFARDGTRPKLGLTSGFHQALDAVAPPSILGRTSSTGLYFLHTPGTRIGLGLLVVLALAGLGWKLWRTSRPVARLALFALVLLVVGAYNGSNVPLSAEAKRINLYRWSWAAALVTWAAIGFAVAVLVGRAPRARPLLSRARAVGPFVLLLVAALIVTSVPFVHAKEDRISDVNEFGAEQRLADAVLARIDKHRPVMVVESGADATFSVGPHVIFRLVQSGLDVEVNAAGTSDYGKDRRYRPGANPTILMISSGKAQLPSGTGEFVAREPFGAGPTPEFDAISAERTALLRRLAAQSSGVKVALAPGAFAFIRRLSSLQAYALSSAIAKLPSDPESALANANLLRLVLAGEVLSPRSTGLRSVDSWPFHRFGFAASGSTSRSRRA